MHSSTVRANHEHRRRTFSEHLASNAGQREDRAAAVGMGRHDDEVHIRARANFRISVVGSPWPTVESTLRLASSSS